MVDALEMLTAITTVFYTNANEIVNLFWGHYLWIGTTYHQYLTKIFDHSIFIDQKLFIVGQTAFNFF